jgi:hypothetical protein
MCLCIPPNVKAISERWAGELCTLDGKRAKVIGRNADFATIATLPDGPAYQWCWQTVDSRMQSDRAFHS